MKGGSSAEEVCKKLMQMYIVQSTPQRLVAYRRYGEEVSNYWTQDKIEQLQWQCLYAQVSYDIILKGRLDTKS